MPLMACVKLARNYRARAGISELFPGRREESRARTDHDVIVTADRKLKAG
jgi:hypothetical protein